MIARSPVAAQPVLFDFDNAPLSTSLPIDLTASDITAHFNSSVVNGYSIQNADVLGFTPVGFSGRSVYPNSINLVDLLISFDQTLTDFSILYACQELGCDDAATMRVTAFMNGAYVGTNTITANNPGTWPSETLSCSFPAGFDSVVVHYDSPPPTCSDYGVIFMADNMWVTAMPTTAIADPAIFIDGLTISNPVSQTATISFSLLQSQNIRIGIYDLTGKLKKNLYAGYLTNGEHQISWDVNDDAKDGLYLLNFSGNGFSKMFKLVVMKQGK